MKQQYNRPVNILLEFEKAQTASPLFLKSFYVFYYEARDTF